MKFENVKNVCTFAFPFHTKMKATRGVAVVGDSGAVLQCTIKDIPIYLGQKVLRNSVLCN